MRVCSEDAALSDLNTNSETVDTRIEEPSVHMAEPEEHFLLRAFSRMRTHLQPFWRRPGYFGVDEGALGRVAVSGVH